MDDVIKAYRCREPERRIPVLRLELDYELALLHEAITEKRQQRIKQSLLRLRRIRDELILLEAI
jgi:hypothetical protein